MSRNRHFFLGKSTLNILFVFSIIEVHKRINLHTNLKRIEVDKVKEKFEKPVLEIVRFDTEDIIQTSGCRGDCVKVCEWHCILVTEAQG